MPSSALLFVAVLLALGARSATASCGAASCPLDLSSHEEPHPGALRLDVSFQYLDQDQPRIGQRRASVGDIPNPEHNEIDTINRIWTFRGDYDFNSRWGLGLALPLTNRTHDHISVDDGTVEHWGFTGLGDLMLQGRFTVLPRQGPTSPVVIVMGGVKVPTGRRGAHNDTELAEVAIQPGSGSCDLLGGLTYAQGVGKVRTPRGDYAWLPVFASVSYKENNPGTNGYRFGDEILLNAGGSYPLLSELELLGQANVRVRLRDYNGGTGEDTSFTGGTFLYLSPGLRWHATEHLAPYAYVQLPVYQRVNQEQSTAPYNLLVGVTCQFGPL